jgi:hypothetical protein
MKMGIKMLKKGKGVKSVEGGTFLSCEMCQRQGGKVMTPVHIPIKQEDGSERMEERIRVETCNLIKKGDGYICNHCESKINH